MQMNNIATVSQNFIGNSDVVISEINKFLNTVKQKNAGKKDFHLVHALVFAKSMTELEVDKINQNLGETYRSCGFDVLGGDTSSGQELSIFISTIVF